MGGLSILYGNIAPEGGVIKVGGVDPSVQVFKGKAICFDSHDEAVAAIDNHTVQKGHVVVIRYEGPKEDQVCQKCWRLPQASLDVG